MSADSLSVLMVSLLACFIGFWTFLYYLSVQEELVKRGSRHEPINTLLLILMYVGILLSVVNCADTTVQPVIMYVGSGLLLALGVSLCVTGTRLFAVKDLPGAAAARLHFILLGIGVIVGAFLSVAQIPSSVI